MTTGRMESEKENVQKVRRRIMPHHHGRGVNWNVKLSGVCCDCGVSITANEAMTTEPPTGERCVACYGKNLKRLSDQCE